MMAINPVPLLKVNGTTGMSYTSPWGGIVTPSQWLFWLVTEQLLQCAVKQRLHISWNAAAACPYRFITSTPS
jgi:hypothetical protein